MKHDRTRLLGHKPIIPAVCEGPGKAGLVSVIIPTYNRGYIIGKTIESVFAQSYSHLELIIVDDGSTDNTRAVIEGFGAKIRYIYQENTGLAAARNTGLLAAEGEFIAFQDSDDVWLPWKLQAQVAIMRKFPELALVWTDMTAVNDNGEVIREKHLSTMYSVYQRIKAEEHLPHCGMVKDFLTDCPAELQNVSFRYGDIYSSMFLGNLVHPPTALLRRQHVHKTGGLDVTFAWTCEDYEFFWRLSRHGLGALIEAPGMLYRVDAEDQLTKPHLVLYIARGNLIAVQRRFQHDLERIKLPLSIMRRHLANAHHWVANEELVADAGTRKKAVSHFWKSFCLDPFQRRAFARFLFRLMLPRSVFALAQSAKRRLNKTATANLLIGSFLYTEFTNTAGELYGAIDLTVPNILSLFSISSSLIVG
jgi:glycosyltransferase involved in cell wall biosynthesis